MRGRFTRLLPRLWRQGVEFPPAKTQIRDPVRKILRRFRGICSSTPPTEDRSCSGSREQMWEQSRESGFWVQCTIRWAISGTTRRSRSLRRCHVLKADKGGLDAGRPDSWRREARKLGSRPESQFEGGPPGQRIKLSSTWRVMYLSRHFANRAEI